MVCFVHFHLEMCFAPQRRALFRKLNFQKWSEHGVFCTFSLQNLLCATTACTFSTSQLQKVVRSWCVLYILTWKCASRHKRRALFRNPTSKSGPRPSLFNTFDFQRRWLFRQLNFQKWSEHGVLYILTWKCASRRNGVHCFDNSTSKSGPSMVCFVHFDLEMCFAPQRRALKLKSTSKSGPSMVCFVHFHFKMCFAPQRRALFRHRNSKKWSGAGCVLYIFTLKCASRHNGVHFFRHLNFQKWSAPEVFCAFWLGNVLRATTACNFSSLTGQLPPHLPL